MLDFNPEQVANQLVQEMLESGILEQFTSEYKNALRTVLGGSFEQYEEKIDEVVTNMVKALVTVMVVVLLKNTIFAQVNFLKQIVDEILSLIPGQGG